MPFVAECLFCRRKVRAPDHAVGASISCPGRGSYFTLLPGAPAPAGQALTAGTISTGIEPEHPPDLNPPAPFTASGRGAAVGRRRLSPLAVTALFLGSLALLFASLPGPDLLSLPCGGLGLLLGLAGVLRARAAGRGLFLALALSMMGFVYGPLGAWLPSLFPARVRYTGASIAFNIGGILGGAVTPLLAQKLAVAGGLELVGVYLGGSAVISLIALIPLRETA